MIQQVLHLKKEVRKQIYASWVGYELSLSHISSLSSKDKTDYYQLLYDFEELYSKDNKIVVMSNRLKGLIAG